MQYDPSGILNPLQRATSVVGGVRAAPELLGPSRTIVQEAMLEARKHLGDLRGIVVRGGRRSIPEQAPVLGASHAERIVRLTAMDEAIHNVDRFLGVASVTAVTADEFVAAFLAAAKECAGLFQEAPERSVPTETSCARCGCPVVVDSPNETGTFCDMCAHEEPSGLDLSEIFREDEEREGYQPFVGEEPGPSWENAVRILEGDRGPSSLT